ncbi:hypothetical protein VNO78_31931 [Psophocarpus tetragonolobus]|uniref:Uncharacterized protein n=1 Tax=Psophocarpus tetragonolobus TaxID=3891 RepID=A0AAN9RZ16_PSOTE
MQPLWSLNFVIKFIYCYFYSSRSSFENNRWAKMLPMVLLCELEMMNYSGRGRIKIEIPVIPPRIGKEGNDPNKDV